jgi:heme/copper-type cytochrome/quinol oxidase subunit 3
MMADVLPLRGRATRGERSARVGMIVFIGGWTMMFGALLVAYLQLRQSAETWPPPGLPTIDRSLPSLATAVLLASSATLQLGLHAIRNARPVGLRGYLLATLALALAFLVLQISSGPHMVHRGLSPTGSLYAAFFFGLTSFHALHVLGGLGGLISLWPRAARGAFSAREHVPVRSWTVYWHFVDVVWIVFFAAVYF